MSTGRVIDSSSDTTQNPSSEIRVLMRRAKSLDREAFARLYGLMMPLVYRYLSVRVNSASEVEELTQEVFIAALHAIQSLRAEDEGGLLAWLFQIARHKLADHLRAHYRYPTHPLEEAEDLEANQLRPDQAAESQEAQAELREALERLTNEQREVVVYKYVLGYDNQRTAQLLGKNPNAVNQLQHRALSSLHRLLSGEERGKQ